MKLIEKTVKTIYNIVMKKLLVIFMLMLIIAVPYIRAECVFAEGKYVKVVFTMAYVFNLPEAKEENILGEYKYGTVFEVLQENIEGSDYYYYKIKISGVDNISEGYILQSQVMDTSIFTPQKELDTNAKISRNAAVYSLKGGEYVETQVILKEGTEIRLISGYDTSVKFSKIQYVNEDGDIITAYIKTSNISVSHISRTLIGVVIIIVTAVSIVLILFGIKKSRKNGIRRIFKKNKN